jgi:hypothetical protein
LGRNAEEQVQLATVYGIFKDVHPSFIKLAYEANSKVSWEDTLKTFSESAEGYKKKLSGLLGEKEYICGGLTWVDFVLADFLQVLNIASPSILANYPNLIRLQ